MESAVFREVPTPLVSEQDFLRFSVQFDPADWHEKLPADVGLSLPATLARAVPKRKMEFLAGRYCISRALILGGFSRNMVTIPSLENRAPLFPVGLTGSITHTTSFASGVVVPVGRKHVCSVGIDTEMVLTEKTLDNIGSRIMHDAEWDARGQSGLGDREYATVLFSAKESIYKCLFPVVQCWFGFHDVMLEGIDGPDGRFRFRLEKDLSPDYKKGWLGEGRYLVEGPLVHTQSALPYRHGRPRGSG